MFSMKVSKIFEIVLLIFYYIYFSDSELDLNELINNKQKIAQT